MKQSKSNEFIRPAEENVLDAAAKDPVPQRPWRFTSDETDEGKTHILIVDATGQMIMDVEGTFENDEMAWLEHMTKCVNICHIAQTSSEKAKKPQVASVNDVKRMLLGGLN